MKECMKKMKLDGKKRGSAAENVDYDTAKHECKNGYKKALFSAGGDVKKADRELKRGGAEASIEAAKSCDATPKECRAARKAAFMESSGEDDDAAEGEGTVRFNIDAIREAAVDYVDAKEEAAEAAGAGTPGGPLRRLQVLNRHLTETSAKTATKSEATTEGCTGGIVCGDKCIAKDPLDAIRKYTTDDVGLDTAVFDANAPTLCDLIEFGDKEVDEVGEAATETTIHFEGVFYGGEYHSDTGRTTHGDDSDKVAMKNALIEYFTASGFPDAKVFESSKEFIEGATTTKEVCFTANVGGYDNADAAKEHARRMRKSKNEDENGSFDEDAVLDKVRATKAWKGRPSLTAGRRRLTEDGLNVTGSTTGQKLKTVPETDTDDAACPTTSPFKCADGSCKPSEKDCGGGASACPEKSPFKCADGATTSGFKCKPCAECKNCLFKCEPHGLQRTPNADKLIWGKTDEYARFCGAADTYYTEYCNEASPDKGACYDHLVEMCCDGADGGPSAACLGEGAFVNPPYDKVCCHPAVPAHDPSKNGGKGETTCESPKAGGGSPASCTAANNYCCDALTTEFNHATGKCEATWDDAKIVAYMDKGWEFKLWASADAGSCKEPVTGGGDTKSCFYHKWGRQDDGTNKCRDREPYESTDPILMTTMGDDRDACCKPPPPYTGCPSTTAPAGPCRPLEDAGFHCYTDMAAYQRSMDAVYEANDLAGMMAGIVISGMKLTDSCPAETFQAPPYKCGQLFDFVKLSDASPTPDRGVCEHYNERCCATSLPVNEDGTKAPAGSGTTDPKNPAAGTDTTDPKTPAAGSGTTDPAKPAAGTGTTDPAKPAEGTGTTDPAKPAEGTGTTDAAAPKPLG